MERRTISPDQGEELKLLYAEHAAAVRRAAAVLASEGIGSPEFQEADSAATALWRRIRVLLSSADQHWMA